MHSPFIPLRVDGTKIDNVEEVDLKASGTCIQMTVITHGEHPVCVAEDGKVIKVPVSLSGSYPMVDSVIALFWVDFTGRGELAECQQNLVHMLSRLIMIVEEFDVVGYITNQVIADPGGGMFISDPKKSTGGYVLAHAATIRLIFRKGKGDQVHSLDAVCAQRHKI